MIDSFWAGTLLPSGSPTAVIIILIGLASLIDLLVGERLKTYLKKLDIPFLAASSFFKRKLFRPERGTRALKTRGALILALCMLPAFWIGSFIDRFIATSPLCQLAGIIMLTYFLGQKALWHITSLKMKPVPAPQTYNEVQKRVSSMIIAFGSRYMPSLLLLLLGGFAGLLAFRFLLVFAEEANSDVRSRMSFYQPAYIVREVLSAPGVMVAYILLYIARIGLPQTALAFHIPNHQRRERIALSHYLPLYNVAVGLHLYFKYEISDYKKQKRTYWIGLDGAKAQLTSKDMAHVWKLLLGTTLMVYFALILLYTYLKVRGGW